MVEPLGKAAEITMKYITTINDREFSVEILEGDEHHIIVDGVTYEINFARAGDQPVYSLLVNGQSFETHVYPAEEGMQVLVHGTLYQANVEDEREKKLRSSLGKEIGENAEFYLKAPMPGLVISVPVMDGQHVEKGDVLLVLESMKMQNELKSPRPGSVARVKIKAGDSVEHKQTLLSVL
jgi:biotin carboxyl carrier protein